MGNHSKDEAEKGLKGWQVVLVAVAGVLVLMVGLALLVHMRVPIPHNSETFTQDDWQAFADMFGAVAGTFFSAVAFSVLIYSSWMQRKELVLQREQLKESQGELKRQADALAAQVEAAQQAARLSAATAILEHHTRMKASMQDPRISGNFLGYEEVTDQIEKAEENLNKIIKEIIGEEAG